MGQGVPGRGRKEGGERRRDTLEGGGEEDEGGAGELHESVSDRGDKWRSGRGRGKGEEIES